MGYLTFARNTLEKTVSKQTNEGEKIEENSEEIFPQQSNRFGKEKRNYLLDTVPSPCSPGLAFSWAR